MFFSQFNSGPAFWQMSNLIIWLEPSWTALLSLFSAELLPMASNASLASLVITVEMGHSDEEGPAEPSHLGEKSWGLRDTSHQPVGSQNQPGHFFLSVDPCPTDPVPIRKPVGQSGPGPGSGGHSCVLEEERTQRRLSFPPVKFPLMAVNWCPLFSC